MLMMICINVFIASLVLLLLVAQWRYVQIKAYGPREHGLSSSNGVQRSINIVVAAKVFEILVVERLHSYLIIRILTFIWGNKSNILLANTLSIETAIIRRQHQGFSVLILLLLNACKNNQLLMLSHAFVTMHA